MGPARWPSQFSRAAQLPAQLRVSASAHAPAHLPALRRAPRSRMALGLRPTRQRRNPRSPRSPQPRTLPATWAQGVGARACSPAADSPGPAVGLVSLPRATEAAILAEEIAGLPTQARTPMRPAAL